MICHYCDHKEVLPKSCTGCGAPEKALITKGIGTQQLVQILKELFPAARIERADLDASKGKRTWAQTVKEFGAGQIDVLVGTQLITKGYHFPNVTLVGIVWADLGFNFPVFNSREIALQKLVQVAGRCGRGDKPGRVVAQLMKKDQIFSYISEETYDKFCEEEMAVRKELLYPPFGRFVQIELCNSDLAALEKDAHEYATELRSVAFKKGIDARVLGPAKPVISRLKNVEMIDIFIKAPSFREIHELLGSVSWHQHYSSSVGFVPTL
jgi:primosomal protein N' (replication factor Y) (superfamily II helicase)